MLKRSVILFLVVCYSILSCSGNSSQPRQRANPEYLAQIQSWQQKRVASLKSPTGWLNLAGLFWLSEGENTAGADPSHAIIFPQDKAPAFAGTFILRDSLVTFAARPGSGVKHNDSTIAAMVMRDDVEGEPTRLTLGTLGWVIIKRGKKYGVRLRDYAHPALQQFAGIETYPVDSTWRIAAKFERYDPPKIIAIPTILNTIDEEPSPGALVFQSANQTYRLDVTGKMTDKELFVIFADQTNGQETYGAGRFVYVTTPDNSDRTMIDFNKAYNPPCAFTPYATCPLPPAQKKLALRVTAGEKNYAHGAH